MLKSKSRQVSDSYMELIHRFPLRPIRSRDEYDNAKEIMRDLARGKKDRGAKDYLDVLVKQIIDFEERSGWRIDTSKLTAADIIQHRIDESGKTMTEIAKKVGISQSNLSEMLSGKRDWSKTAIRGFMKLYKIEANRFFV